MTYTAGVEALADAFNTGPSALLRARVREAAVALHEARVAVIESGATGVSPSDAVQLVAPLYGSGLREG